MQERRKVPRSRTLKSGKIIVHAHTSLVDCTVRNLSSKGALLVVASLVGIPEKFDLLLSCGFVDRATTPANVFRAEMREAVLLGTALARFSETIEGFMRECTEGEIAMLFAEDRDSLHFAIK